MDNCIQTLTRKSRSTRRFKEYKTISEDLIVGLIEIARLCPSARNRQPLKYIISVNPEETARIRYALLWALDLPDWDGPSVGERPPAYITIVAPENCSPDPALDLGIAAQTILLAAAEQGISGCMFGSIKREELKLILPVPEGYAILLVIALGYSDEEIRLEPLSEDGDTRYWRTSEGIHHVPKRSLKDCIIQRQ
ncbi:nitroreductase family protein [Methanocalculus taiwanensis]|uniref:Nitroreductase family protein n=1 Tax=Methanocalculus taiwanensis TaxID=106207 RepID=A0ABD4TJD6_9EURY|nr:nitroreductase family protein [Methanocalculus taiwanensis]MCQ1538881.1 nitroreductase family protein [Methanocalculus taiwanensis]